MGVRTTLNLDEDVFHRLKSYAKSRSVPLGTAVSELIRRGLSAERPTRLVNGLLIVDLPADSPRVTTELVRQLEG